MAGKNNFKNLVFYGGVTKEEYSEVQNLIVEENFKVWKVISVILAIVAMGFLVTTYLFPEYFAYNDPSSNINNINDIATKYGIAYSVLAIYSILLAFYFYVWGKKYPKVIMPLIQITNFLVLAFFASIATILDSINISVIFLILLVIATLVTVRSPLRNTLIILSAMTGFIILACIFENKPQNVDTFQDDIVYCVLFSILSIIFGFFFNTIRIKSFALRHFVEEQRDFDTLTKTKSKIAYDREVRYIMEKLYQNSSCEPFAVVVFDVNSLKLTNDTYGHEMGDELLIRAANLISNHFECSKVYRIGGDEFVVIAKDEDYKNRNEIVRKFRNSVHNIHEHSDSLNNDVPIACGMATYDPENDVDYMAVFTRADTIMYDDKRTMKLNNKYLTTAQLKKNEK